MVVLEHSINIHSWKNDLSLLRHLKTYSNPLGLFLFFQHLSNYTLILPSLDRGSLQIQKSITHQPNSLQLRLFENELQTVCLGGNKEERLVAVGCRMGKVVKVVGVERGEVVFRLKRGF